MCATVLTEDEINGLLDGDRDAGWDADDEYEWTWSAKASSPASQDHVGHGPGQERDQRSARRGSVLAME
ncbi:hypothetical protein VR41_07845 [Streptomyces sp. NRRL B-1568]|nr:hypothetical protein VR41_07845 [Streptomyces sp. NRRL B-1568]